jgi:phytoene synthase
MRKDSLLSKHAKTFYWAGLFLPKETFTKCSHLYDFCRTLDDIADQNKELSLKKNNSKLLKKNSKKKITLYLLLKTYGDSLRKKIFLKKLF